MAEALIEALASRRIEDFVVERDDFGLAYTCSDFVVDIAELLDAAEGSSPSVGTQAAAVV